MKPGGPQFICWPVLDENSKERFSKERPRPVVMGAMEACGKQDGGNARSGELSVGQVRLGNIRLGKAMIG